jgi:hypothetical protein
MLKSRWNNLPARAFTPLPLFRNGLAAKGGYLT